MFDLVAFVVMAVAMGLISAIALAAVALLFASQAQASEARQGTLILRRIEAREAVREPLQATKVVLRVTELMRPQNVRRCDEPQDGGYEGDNVLPLPETAFFDPLRGRMDQRMIGSARPQERGEARRSA